MNKATVGFTYTLELIKDGKVIDTEVVHNLVPVEGINYLITTGLRGGSALTSWYIGLYEGTYTPLSTDTAATFPASSTESTAYAESTRQLLTLGAPAAGIADNSANVAVFTGNTNGKIIRGGFIASNSAKSSTAGVLISAVQFSSAKAFDAGTILRVTTGFNIAST